MDRKPIIIQLTKEDLERIKELTIIQTKKYGHDKGHFVLGRTDSSHEIGFVGEIGFLRFLKQGYGFKEPDEIGLCEMGAEFDIYIFIEKVKHGIHVKTGRWKEWPEDDWTFGVHWDQGIEKSSSPVVLISYLKDNLSVIRIEGFMTAEEIGKCKIIKKGEPFPGMNYPSRCDNWLTYFRQYKDIKKLVEYLK